MGALTGLAGPAGPWRRSEILEGAKELRIMLCRQRQTGSKTGTSVIAACGAWRRGGAERARWKAMAAAPLLRV